jgi:hypothetical protein
METFRVAAAKVALAFFKSVPSVRWYISVSFAKVCFGACATGFASARRKMWSVHQATFCLMPIARLASVKVDPRSARSCLWPNARLGVKAFTRRLLVAPASVLVVADWVACGRSRVRIHFLD